MCKSTALNGLVLASLMVAAVAVAECTDCGVPGFPEAADFLAGHGYPAEQFTVLLAWEERTGGGEMVSGYRVQPVDGGEPFDLYSGIHGELLDQSQLGALGVKPKDWNLAPIERKTEAPRFQWKTAPARPVPVGPSLKLLAAPVLGLEPLSDAELNPAPEYGVEKPSNRIGLVRQLPGRVSVRTGAASAGAWRDLPDGNKMWTLTVRSAGARAIRVHFTGVALPHSASIVIYNTSEPAESYGPFTSPDFARNGSLWSPSCFADSCTIECVVAANDAGDTLGFEIDRICHTYKEFGDIAWAKEGSCNLDVSCYPEWYPVSLGVAAFSFMPNEWQLYCTGTLLVDSDPETSIPYFLTANHCMDEPSEAAEDMEFFWLYQSTECDGAAPNLSTVPRTSGGADLLARESVTDFALVRLHNAPPAGAAFIGWTTDHVEVGSAVAAIHHPSGSPKRISFGHITDTGSPLSGGVPPSGRTYEFFLESLWDRAYRNPEWADGGTTEPGSSGCPLFLRESQLVVGQLWGGYASCSMSDEPDYFGRFEKTFPVVDQWLGEGEGEGEEGEGEVGEGEGEGEAPPDGCFAGGLEDSPLVLRTVAGWISFFLHALVH